MQYIIMDLEWNNAYCRKSKGFINEIIEIGAVKLDSDLKKVDTFSQLIKAQIGKKLRGRVKELTSITNDDILHGIPFTKALSDFKHWIGNEDTIVLTWGNCDIRVLLDNYKYLNGITFIPFLTKYVDLQRYFQSCVKTGSKEQIGLSAAAELLDIDPEKYSVHRALEDSYLSAECFIKIFDKNKLEPLIRVCDGRFYEALLYKAKYITAFSDPLFDKNELKYICEQCGKKPKQLADWKVINKSFRAIFYCEHCDRKVRVSIRFKKHFDHVDIKKNINLITRAEETKADKPTEASENNNENEKRET